MITINMVFHLFMRLQIFANSLLLFLFSSSFVSQFELWVFFSLSLCAYVFLSIQVGIFYFMYNMCMYENEKVMRFNDNLLHGL